MLRALLLRHGTGWQPLGRKAGTWRSAVGSVRWRCEVVGSERESGVGGETVDSEELLRENLKEAERQRKEMKERQAGASKSWAQDAEAKRRFMDKVAETHGVKEAEDWKKVTYDDIKGMGGSVILRHYPSVFALLADVYPEKKLSVFQCRAQVPRGYWEEAEHRRQFVAMAAERLGIREEAQWAQVSKKQITQLGGGSLLRKYKSLASLLEDVGVASSSSLSPAAFVRKPKDYFKEEENQREFLRHVGRQLGVSSAEEWSQVKQTEIYRMGGKALLAAHGNSLRQAVATLLADEIDVSSLAEAKWKAPRGYYDSAVNRRAYLDEMAVKLGVTSPQEWAKVSYADLEANGGATLIQRYPSILAMLQDVYPEAGITAFDRKVLPKGYWDAKENRKAFMDRVAEEHRVTKAEEWRKVKEEHVREMGGSGLLAIYPSLLEVLQDVYPDEEITSFASRPKVQRGHWASMANRRKFLDHVAATFQIESPKDWKRVSEEAVKQLGGSRLLAQYSSLYEALQDVYPEEKWDVFKCRRKLPTGYWKSKANILAFMEKVKRKYKIKRKEDWYRVSIQQLMDLRGGHLMAQMKLVDALRSAYPDEEWDGDECARRVKKSSQRLVALSASTLLPGFSYQEDVKLPAMRSDAVRDGKGGYLELDLYFPDLALAFEYNGEHHYKELGFFGPVEMYQKRDANKRKLCKENGITLVTVPYWWDKSLESLAATIQEKAPAVMERVGEKERSSTAQRVVEQVAKGQHEPISPFLDTWKPLLGKTPKLPQALHESINPSAYLVCENFCGTRVRWTNGELATVQHGRVLEVPEWWKEQLPAEQELEGFLWMGYDKVGLLSRLLAFKSAPRGRTGSGITLPPALQDPWQQVQFLAYDVPVFSEFGTRVAQLQKLEDNEVLRVVRYDVCQDRAHLDRLLQEVTDRGGDGLLLRYPKDRYDGPAAKKQDTFFRMKAVQQGTVTMVEPSKTLNSLVVVGPTGKTQIVRCSTQVYAEPPQAGTKLSIGHIGQWDSGRFKYPFLLGEE